MSYVNKVIFSKKFDAIESVKRDFKMKKLVIAIVFPLISISTFASNYWMHYETKNGTRGKQGPYSTVEKCERAARGTALDLKSFECRKL